MPESGRGRLRGDVFPERYQIHLHIKPETRLFSGVVSIDLQIDTPVQSIILHALDLKIDQAALGQMKAELAINALAETITLSFPGVVPSGQATLSVSFSGILNRQMRGLYESHPNDGEVFAFTQLEATDARRMFPCFDEPGMKAAFGLTVTIPTGLMALSNMPVVDEKVAGETKTVTFDETPVMSSYLLALAVARLEKKEVKVGETTVAVWTLPGQVNLGDFALKVTSAVLPLLNAYFDLPYPIPKLDLVSVPDFAMGAMENWGAIFFRDSRLLLDEGLASTSTQQAVASVITHEIVHQWFGNLVTMAWWDDLWLNESFATWLACKILDQWRPEWHVWLSFQQEKEVPLALDALANTRPIHSDVTDAAEIEEMFDALTYEKGAACLRMIEQFLGENPFRKGIRRYMRRYQYQNASAADLWRELEAASGQPVSDIAKDWFSRAGFPIIRIASKDRSHRTLSLSQERFSASKRELDSAPGEPPWPVPCTLRYQDSEGLHTHRVLLDKAVTTCSLPGKGAIKWLYGNAGELGFYRINDDPKRLDRLQKVGAKVLSPAEKIGFLSHLWALIQRGDLPISFFMKTLCGYKRDSTRVVVEAVCGYLETLSNHMLEGPDQKRFLIFSGQFLRPLWRIFGWDSLPGEDDEQGLTRAVLLWTLGAVAQDEDILSELPRRQSRYHVRPGSIDPSLVTPLIRLCARSDGGTRFEQYLSRFQRSSLPESRDRYLLALTDFGKPALAARVLDFALSDKVRPQDVWKPVRYLLANPAVQDITWTFVQKNWSELRAKGGSVGAQRMIQGCRHLWQAERYDEVSAFFGDPEKRPSAANRAFRQTLEFMQIGIYFKQQQGPGLSVWLRENVFEEN